MDLSRCLVLVGPTGSGKTQLTRRLAFELNAEVVCMDSMQLYSELSIGTARPTHEEMADIPHHLFGGFSVDDPLNSARYATLAEETITAIQARNRIPLLVGGTGLYFQALFQGFAKVPETPPALRRRLEKLAERKGPRHLYRLLQRLDPEGANHLHANDRQRTQRFLEVRLLSGRSILAFWAEQKREERKMPLTLGLQVARDLLLERLEARSRAMLAGGWLEETRQLLNGTHWRSILRLKPIGYHAIARFLEGDISRKELFDAIDVQTRLYAKRQMTWFRKLYHIRWFTFDRHSGYNVNAIIDAVFNHIKF